MVKYENSTVYKIIGDDPSGLCYVGSTSLKHLGDRMGKHRSNYRTWVKSGKLCKRMTRSVQIFDMYGIDNCKIVPLEKVNAKSKHELHEREQHYIDSLNCVNNLKAISWTKEYKIEYDKQYRNKNQDKLKAQRIKYYNDNKDKIKEKYKTNYIEKRDIICARVGKYRQANPELIKARKKHYAMNQGKETIKRQQQKTYYCPNCGHEIRWNKKSRHFRTDLHITNTIKFMESTIETYRQVQPIEIRQYTLE